MKGCDRFVPAPSSTAGDLVDLLDAILVGGDSGVVGPAAPGTEAAPGSAQGPVAQEVAVEVGLIVSGLRGVGPETVLWGGVHGAQSRRGAGSFRESPIWKGRSV